MVERLFAVLVVGGPLADALPLPRLPRWSVEAMRGVSRRRDCESQSEGRLSGGDLRSTSVRSAGLKHARNRDEWSDGRKHGSDGWDERIGRTDGTDGWDERMGRTDETDGRDGRMERTDGPHAMDERMDGWGGRMERTYGTGG